MNTLSEGREKDDPIQDTWTSEAPDIVGTYAGCGCWMTRSCAAKLLFFNFLPLLVVFPQAFAKLLKISFHFSRSFLLSQPFQLESLAVA